MKNNEKKSTVAKYSRDSCEEILHKSLFIALKNGLSSRELSFHYNLSSLYVDNFRGKTWITYIKEKRIW